MASVFPGVLVFAALVSQLIWLTAVQGLIGACSSLFRGLTGVVILKRLL